MPVSSNGLNRETLLICPFLNGLSLLKRGIIGKLPISVNEDSSYQGAGTWGKGGRFTVYGVRQKGK